MSDAQKDDAMLATLLLRPDCSVERGAELSFVAALAVMDVVRHYCPLASVQLKWPNDILLSKKKTCGILLESGSKTSHQLDWLAVGIGINLLSHPETDGWPATHIHEHGFADTAADTLLALAHYWDKWFQSWKMSGFAAIRQAWIDNAAGIGSEITARLPNIEYVGIFEDIDINGTMILKTQTGIQKVTAADIYFSTTQG